MCCLFHIQTQSGADVIDQTLSPALSNPQTVFRWIFGVLFFVILFNNSFGQVSLEQIIEADAVEDIEVLIQRVGNDNASVRWGAIVTLGQNGKQAGPAIPAIVQVVKNRQENGSIRISAVRAIALIISPSDPSNPAFRDAVPSLITVVPVLAELADSQNSDARSTAASALVRVANFLYARKAVDAIPSLKSAGKILQSSKYAETRRMTEAIDDTVLYLQLLWIKQLLPNWITNYPYVPVIAGVYFLLLTISLFLLWLYPIGLWMINERISDSIEVTLPNWMGGIRLPLRYLLPVGFFHFHPRVLDAWVEKHLETAAKVFAQKPAVKDREIFVPIAVDLDGEPREGLDPAELQPAFLKRQTLILVAGEGGAGKTSLACMLGKSAMNYGQDRRLCKEHAMLPVLLDPDVDLRSEEKHGALLEFIRQQLKMMINESEAPSEKVVKHLLKKRRVLLIIDSLSEMSEVSRSLVRSSIVKLPVNAAIITSRSSEASFKDLGLHTVTPIRVTGDNISIFFGAYLTKRKKRSEFNDTDFFSMCRQFSAMVKDKGTTPLFATLYAEQVICKREKSYRDDLPMNIPDLMLCYLNQLNRSIDGHGLDDRTVHSAAQAIAWECLRQTYRPASARLDAVLKAFGSEEMASSVISYLEQRLKIIKTVGFGKDYLRFTLDPLSEYLASFHVIDKFSGDRDLWNEFFVEADKQAEAPESIMYFLLALHDCCLTNEKKVTIPPFVFEELRARIETVSKN
jgi:Predicted NTPase (NACHT family)